MRVPFLNFEGGPGVLLLNFEGGPGVPLLNFGGGSRVPSPRVRVPGPGVLVPLLHHAVKMLRKSSKFYPEIFAFKVVVRRNN